jgi:hypothetical protein
MQLDSSSLFLTISAPGTRAIVILQMAPKSASNWRSDTLKHAGK